MRILLSLLLLSSTLSFAQSPWTQKKGKAFTQISYSTISEYKALFGSPDYATERVITDNTIQIYGEYGLSDKTSLVLNLPIKLLKSGSAINPNVLALTKSDNLTAFGNMELGVKHNFYNKKWLVTGQLNIEANTSSYDKPTGLRSGIDAFTVTPLITAGRGYNKLYYQAFVGAHLRTNNYSSALKVGGEIGVKPINRLWLIAYVDVVSSFNNENRQLPLENVLTGLYLNDQEYGGFGLKAVGEFTNKFGATASFGGAFFGNNVAKKAAYNFGLYHKF